MYATKYMIVILLQIFQEVRQSKELLI